MIAKYVYSRARGRRSADPLSPPPSGERRPKTAVQGTVIDAHGLVKRYGTLTAVDRVEFSVQGGEIFGLLGPNGAGKTTTLEMLEGLRTPDEGDAVVLGESVVRARRTIKERIR